MIATQVKKLSILVAILVFSLLGSIPVFAAETSVSEPAIETTATGEVEADPDIAYINIQVRTEESTSDLSQQNNAAAVNQAIAALQDGGVAKDDINTQYYSSYSYTKIDPPEAVMVPRELSSSMTAPAMPEPVPEKGKEVTVFVTESTLKATARNLDKVGALLTELAKIPTVRINGVQYALENILQYKKAAIYEAISEAKLTIEYTAAALGVELGSLRSVRVDFNNYYYGPMYTKEMAYGAGGGMDIAQPQNPDKIKVQATAYLVYTAK